MISDDQGRTQTNSASAI